MGRMVTDPMTQPRSYLPPETEIERWTGRCKDILVIRLLRFLSSCMSYQKIMCACVLER